MKLRHLPIALLILAAVFVRFYDLTADPPTWLSSSAGLFSDEGIYSGDSRSQAVFGHWMRGDFHSAIVCMPLYWLQLAVFKMFGATLVSARSISAILGFAAIALIWLALRNCEEPKAANIAALLLGFMPLYALYNRLALMETPVVFALAAAFALITIRTGGNRWSQAICIAIGGLCFALAVETKSLAWLTAPAFMYYTWKSGWKKGALFLATITASCMIFYVEALKPFASDLARMNAYYLHHQYLPHTPIGEWGSIKRALITGKRDGFALTFLRLIGFSLLLLIAKRPVSAKWRRASLTMLALWLGAPMLFWLMTLYTPSRYYVLIAPPTACIMALWLSRLDWRAASWRIAAVTVVFISMDLLGICRAAHTTRDATAQLSKFLPAGSVIAGQFAPEASMGTQLEAVYTQPGLANDGHNFRKLKVDAIIVTRSPYWDGWWRRQSDVSVDWSNPQMTVSIGSKFLADIYGVKK